MLSNKQRKMRFYSLVLNGVLIFCSLPSNAKEIKLHCRTIEQNHILNVVVLDEIKRKVSTVGNDGAFHERKLKKLSPYQLVFADEMILDGRKLGENWYLETNTTYKINRIDGFYQVEIEVRTNPEAPYKNYFESGSCVVSDKKSVF